MDKPTAFKHWIDVSLLKKMAKSLAAIHPRFDQKSFVKLAPKLDPLELKPRVRLVRDHLKAHLPEDYLKALAILLKSSDRGDLTGFDLWPYTEFVQTYGLDHLGPSLEALKSLTQKFTSEFAVRPFIKASPDETLAFLLKCASHPDVHIRRWVSEGTRSRLPWGDRLNLFIEKPRLTLPLLEKLKYDEELYVRKSVANHLNDLSKDHPDLMLEVLSDWRKSCPKEHLPKIEWITRHSLRTLIKAGNPKAMRFVGASPDAKVELVSMKLNKAKFRVSEKIEMMLTLRSLSSKKQKIVVDYAIHYQKANGKTSPKVFKLKTMEIDAHEKLDLVKGHSLKEVTTRSHYPGVHYVEIFVNGKSLSKLKWVMV